MEDHLVIGAGQVGTALAKVLGCKVRDVEPHEGTYKTLHITFPYLQGKFHDQVFGYVKEHQAELVVIHSTVPPKVFLGTDWVMSPVRGRHPNLYEGIRTFVKHFGGYRAAEAAAPFRHVGVPVKIHDKAETLAVAKIAELAQLGVEVAMMKEIEAVCRREGVPFAEVYRQFGRTYNNGYETLGDDRFTKPILNWSEGPLGGHCVAQNTWMLDSMFFDNIVDAISPEHWGIRYDKGWH